MQRYKLWAKSPADSRPGSVSSMPGIWSIELASSPQNLLGSCLCAKRPGRHCHHRRGGTSSSRRRTRRLTDPSVRTRGASGTLAGTLRGPVREGERGGPHLHPEGSATAQAASAPGRGTQPGGAPTRGRRPQRQEGGGRGRGGGRAAPSGGREQGEVPEAWRAIIMVQAIHQNKWSF